MLRTFLATVCLTVAMLSALPATAVANPPPQTPPKSESIEQIRRRAESGDVESQFQLGLAYQYGDGVPQNTTEAIKWITRSAERGNAEAQSTLGWIHSRGDGVPQNTAEAIKWWTRAADQGNVEEQNLLATAYENGVVVRRDMAQAIKWYTRAAEAGDAQSQMKLATIYDQGKGVPRNMVEAIKWYIRVAEKVIPEPQPVLGEDLTDAEISRRALLDANNNAIAWLAKQRRNDAQHRLASIYRTGDGVPKNTAEAIKWFTRAAEEGDASAQFSLGVIFDTGDGVPKNTPEAIRWYTQAAEQGVASAGFYLGVIHFGGEGEPKNTAEAIKWFTRAAELGYASAQFNLGVINNTGDGVPKDTAEATKWFTLAAEQGDLHAQLSLGWIFSEADGIPRSMPEAIKWYTRAAEQGSVLAQVALGVIFDTGDGVPKNTAEAIRWYTQAAEQGDADAQFNLGVIFDTGDGVPKNAAEAAKWYTRAAEQESASAQYNLSGMHWRGEGVPKNLILAYYWANLAAAAGEERASKRREWLAEEMTREQIAEAQRLSAAFKPRVWKVTADTEDTPLQHAVEQQPDTFGSGFFVTTDGYFVTNHHVVDQATRIRIITPKGTYSARVVRTDPANDLALLKAEGRFSALHVRGSTGLRSAERVSTVGFPNPDLQGQAPKYSSGEIAALTGPGDDPRFFQISVPVQPGNSGGPLVDSSGSVVGVIVGKLDAVKTLRITGQIPENVNYAIKGNLLVNLLESVPNLPDQLIARPTAPPGDAPSVAKAVEDAAGMVITFQ
ncbi:MAG: SEL1-like repeat protein [Phycisphaeraceae bacterium]|nr:SEL1-like repeat protein [Phycisphaeraceae bacterium]